MSISEFKAWLDGYTLAGGKDISVIQAKLSEVTDFQYQPYVPWTPTTPTIQPWWTTSGTGTYEARPGGELVVP